MSGIKKSNSSYKVVYLFYFRYVSLITSSYSYFFMTIACTLKVNGGLASRYPLPHPIIKVKIKKKKKR